MITSKYLFNKIVTNANIDASKIEVKNDKFYDMVLSNHSLGLGESYMLNYWDYDSVDQLFYRLCREKIIQKFKPSYAMMLKIVFNNLYSRIFNRQSITSSKQVALKHYDISNEMYKNMLDKYMMYSCGYWLKANNLQDAQIAKLDLICKKVGLHQPNNGDKKLVLDIGCGWGGFAKYAEQYYNVRVIGLTISKQQYEHIKQDNQATEVLMQDYRNLLSEYENKFDAIVSIGMFEHVGPDNYNKFMQVCSYYIKDEGLILLHTIGGLKARKVGEPWTDKYIFPNYVLPTLGQICNASETTDLVVEDFHNFGADYDKTLMAWNDNFNKWLDINNEPLTDEFIRMWRYYLLQCAGLFRARDLQLFQVVLSKNGIVGGYVSVR